MKCIPLSFWLSIYEIWWNCYLSQSWRSGFSWREHPYIICVFPGVLMEELDLKWEVSEGSLQAIALKGDGTNIRATRTRAVCKLRLLPGSMMAAILLEAGARVWGGQIGVLREFGFFLVWWKSLLWMRHGQDLSWSMELQFWVGSSFPMFACAIVMMVSPSWLEMGLGPEGLELHFWAGSVFFLVCVCLHTGNGSLTLSKEQC